jgi:hypothetical protein
MVNESGVELGSLAEDILDVLLANESEVNLLEEFLARRVGGDCLLKLLEVGHARLDGVLRLLDEVILLATRREYFIEFLLLFHEHRILRLLPRVHLHQVLHDVDVCQALHCLSQDLSLFPLCVRDILKGVTDHDGLWVLSDFLGLL